MEEEKKECPDCRGTGSLDGDYEIPCPICDGSGEVPIDYKGWLGNFFETQL